MMNWEEQKKEVAIRLQEIKENIELTEVDIGQHSSGKVVVTLTGFRKNFPKLDLEEIEE